MTSRFFPFLLITFLVLTGGCNTSRNQDSSWTEYDSSRQKNKEGRRTQSRRRVKKNNADGRHRRRRRKRQHGRDHQPRRQSTQDSPTTQTVNDDTTAKSTDTMDTAEEVIAKGQSVYDKYCSSCHGPDRKASRTGIPALTDIDQRLSDQDILNLINEGRGRMPSFNYISESRKNALVEFLTD